MGVVPTAVYKRITGGVGTIQVSPPLPLHTHAAHAPLPRSNFRSTFALLPLPPKCARGCVAYPENKDETNELGIVTQRVNPHRPCEQTKVRGVYQIWGYVCEVSDITTAIPSPPKSISPRPLTLSKNPNHTHSAHTVDIEVEQVAFIRGVVNRNIHLANRRSVEGMSSPYAAVPEGKGIKNKKAPNNEHPPPVRARKHITPHRVHKHKGNHACTSTRATAGAQQSAYHVVRCL